MHHLLMDEFLQKKCFRDCLGQKVREEGLDQQDHKVQLESQEVVDNEDSLVKQVNLVKQAKQVPKVPEEEMDPK